MGGSFRAGFALENLDELPDWLAVLRLDPVEKPSLSPRKQEFKGWLGLDC